MKYGTVTDNKVRILIDTNVLFSALLFPDSKPAQAVLLAISSHSIVLCERNIIELKRILQRKAPKYIATAEDFLAELSYELIPAIEGGKQLIRDATDHPILNAAFEADVDLILTGDNDFLSLKIKRPKCINAAQFLEKYTDL
jgi:putative PIN family toxin of toxin-antitoxin system